MICIFVFNWQLIFANVVIPVFLIGSFGRLNPCQVTAFRVYRQFAVGAFCMLILFPTCVESLLSALPLRAAMLFMFRSQLWHFSMATPS